MIDYKIFRYAGCPRTGTTWMLQALKAAGLGEGQKTHVHQTFDSSPINVFHVSTIRNPCSWLASYYAAIYPGCTTLPAVDRFRFANCKTFDDFIRSYLNHTPGAVGEMFATYHANTCLRLEDYPWNVIELLDTFDVPKYKYDLIQSIPALNKTKPEKLPRWDTELRREVIQAEKAFVERYEYT
jgi:hypothetical protein